MNCCRPFVRVFGIAAMLLGSAVCVPANGQQRIRAFAAQGGLLTQIIQNNWFRYRIVNGRIMVDGSRLSNIQQAINGKDLKESFSLSNENGQPLLKYERTNLEEHLVIEAAAANDRLLIRREPVGKSTAPAVEFSQVANEKTSLTIGLGDTRQVFRGQGIWHLLIASPKQCREFLPPLLEILRPDWKLADMAVDIESRLLRDADVTRVSSRARWAELVSQLADDSYAKREAADRALRAGDAGVIDYLQRLDYKRLDAEQQFRISRIIDALGQANDDTVDQVAFNLAGDPAVWLLLLDRPEPTTRQTAARQLTALLGEPIAVDPVAPPDTQKDKRQLLRAKIEARP